MQNSHASESDDDVDDIDDMFYDYSNSSDGKLYHISDDIMRALKIQNLGIALC